MRHVLGASFLLGFLLVMWAGSSMARIEVASGALAVVVFGLLAAFLFNYRDSHPWAASLLQAALLLGMLRELLGIAFALHWLELDVAGPSLLPLLVSSSALAGPIGSSLALLFLAYRDGVLHQRAVQLDAEQLRRLVDSSDHGICQIDCGGRITFVNSIAAEMLAIEEELPSGAWIQEKLKAGNDESSIRAIAAFVLRPIAAVTRATAVIARPNQPAITAEWSVSPVHCNGETVGATLTLRDITEQEANDRFIRFRTELLEMIARNKPVEESIPLLVSAVEQRLPGGLCSVLVCDGDFFQVITSSRIPEDLRSALQAVRCNRIIQTTDRRGSLQLKNWEDTLRAVARDQGYSGTWAEPMVSSANELLGTVVLNHDAITSLEPSQNATLREAAHIGALAFEHHGAYQRLLHQGYHDALTGLPNRLLLADRLKQGLARAERNRTHLAFLSIDLDHFKDVNDNFGHDAGDLFLRQISARLAARVRASDTLARTGGDEFTVVLPDLHDARDAGKVAESLIASLADPFEVDDHELYGSASIGIAIFPRDGREGASLQRNADRAMYRAKAEGRNRIRYYSGDETIADRDRIDIELQLHRAIEQKSFSLCFQPQYNCDRQLDGFEALLRFQHPKLGMVPPSRFIPMAEENGLILPIGDWVLNEVCRQIREWQDKGLRPIRVAMNVSPLQLSRGDFSESVYRTIRDKGIKPELLEIELTEGVLMSSVPESARQVAELARIGVRLSVDDFGTGYSCLSYLHQLPLHNLKIDRSFISRMLEPEGTRCIVEAIITLARKIGLKTIAEGVETEEQLTFLRAVGCDLIQGYLMSKPLSPVDAAAVLWKSTMSEPSGYASVGPANVPARSHRPGWSRSTRRRMSD